MSVTNVSATPKNCADEIDVTWTNDGRAASMAIDRVANGSSTSHVRTRTRNIPQPWHDTTVASGNNYQYRVFNWDRNGNSISPPGVSNSALAGGCSFLESTAFIQKYPAIFEVLVPRGAVINDYTHEEGSILEGLWKHVHQLALPNNDAGIQAETVNLIQGISGDLEVVARLSPSGGTGSDYLVAYEFDPQTDWNGPVNLVADNGPIDHVTGSTALIQSTYNYQGHFELLVPRGAVIDHYIHENGSILEGQWRHVHTLKAPHHDPQAQFKAVVLIQSSSGSLEAIARLSSAEGSGDYLVAYELSSDTDSGDESVSESESASGSFSEVEVVSVSESASGSISEVEVVSVSESAPSSISESEFGGEGTWRGPVKVMTDSGPIDHVTGSAALLESNQGEFELLVPQGALIGHYVHEEGSIREERWRQVHTLKSPQDNVQITANWLIQSRSGKFEAIARISPLSGGGDDFLVGYEADPGTEWQGPVKLVADDGPIMIGQPSEELS